MVTLVPSAAGAMRTSSARPAMTARPTSSGSRSGTEPTGGTSKSTPRAAPLPATAPAPAGRLTPAGRSCSDPGPASVTTTWNCSPSSVSDTRMGSSGQCRWCASTAREQASPTARRTSSSSASGTPLRRATAVATSRAVRTCAGNGVNVISTVGMICDVAASLLRLPGGDGLIHAVMDAEDLGQPGDPEDLQDALLRAHQVQRAVVGTDALEAADEHAQAGG